MQSSQISQVDLKTGLTLCSIHTPNADSHDIPRVSSRVNSSDLTNNPLGYYVKLAFSVHFPFGKTMPLCILQLLLHISSQNHAHCTTSETYKIT